MSKRTKYQGLGILPISVNFSELEISVKDGDIVEFDVGDDGIFAKNLYDSLELECNILQILHNLNDREKVVFLYQLIRESGYRIDHESLAETLHIKRQWYSTMLSKVKAKAKMILREYYKYKER